jgi:hypothetical protein
VRRTVTEAKEKSKVKFARSRLLAGAAVAAVAGVATGGAIARADDSAALAQAAAGGVSLTPAAVEHTTKRGNIGRMTITNTTGNTLRMTIKVRPWVQKRDTGNVAANLRGNLSPYVVARTPRFKLKAGKSRRVTFRVRRTPPGGSLYAGIEVFGKPLRVKARNGIIPQYRVIGKLRLNPRHRRPRLRVGAVDVVRHRSGRVLILAVRNTGNTLDAVGGSATISGPSRRHGTITPMTPVPGQVVYLVGSSMEGMRHGSYRANFTITQGKRRCHASRTFRY